MRNFGPLIGAIDQGTSSTRFLIFAAKSGQLLASDQLDVRKIFPNEGFVEMNPIEMYDSVITTINRALEKLKAMDVNLNDIKGVGLTNQRESAIVWDRFTGKPLYNCIVWLDNRTSDLVDTILDRIPRRDLNYLKTKTGLPISPYFSALKIKWMIDNVPEVRDAIANNRLMFGTVDSWILWKLTDEHYTDVTNASRTLLMDIETLEWDQYLCDFFGIPMKILPKIKSSSEIFAYINMGPLKGIPISGVIGDQSAALVGQRCFDIGQAKVTYGTGCFLIQNIGPGPVHGALNGVLKDAKNKLITTVAYKFGSNPACYALEGSVAIAGAAIAWLKDGLQIVKDYDEIEPSAKEDPNARGVFFVPAFQGLYAPYWDANATGTIIGISQFTRKCHIVRATLEGVAFQTNDILLMMRDDRTGIKIDGGMSRNDLFCQILADISGWVVIRPKMIEATALGAAMVAGHSLGVWDINSFNEPINKSEADNHDESIIHMPNCVHNYSRIMNNVRRSLSLSHRFSLTSQTSLPDPEECHCSNYDIFSPDILDNLRIDKINMWRSAVSRCRRWTRIEKQEQKKVEYLRLSSIPFMMFVLLSFGSIILSEIAK